MLDGGHGVKAWGLLMHMSWEKSPFVAPNSSVMMYGVLYSLYFCDSNICKRPKSRGTQQYLGLSSLLSMALAVLATLA